MEGEGKTKEESCLGMGLEASHVANRVNSCSDPESRCKGGKKKAECVHPELESDTWEEMEKGVFDRFSLDYGWNHGGDNRKFEGRSKEGPKLPEISSSLPSEENKHCSDSGDEKGKNGLDGINSFQKGAPVF